MTIYRCFQNARNEYWTYRSTGQRMWLTADQFWAMAAAGAKIVFVK